jgi:hypothetical protein
MTLLSTTQVRTTLNLTHIMCTNPHNEPHRMMFEKMFTLQYLIRAFAQNDAIKYNTGSNNIKPNTIICTNFYNEPHRMMFEKMFTF